MTSYVDKLKRGATSRRTDHIFKNIIELESCTSQAMDAMESMSRIGRIVCLDDPSPYTVRVGMIVTRYVTGKTHRRQFTHRLTSAVPNLENNPRVQALLAASRELDISPTQDRLAAYGRALHRMLDGQEGPLCEFAAEAAVLEHQRGNKFDFAALRRERGVDELIQEKLRLNLDSGSPALSPQLDDLSERYPEMRNLQYNHPGHRL